MEKKSAKGVNKKYVYALGRRKTAFASARLYEGKGENLIDGKKAEEVYSRRSELRSLQMPFEITETLGKYFFTVRTKGGGKSGQLAAIQLALARALEKADQSYRKPLKKVKLLTRDARMKERKKPGLKKARKREQYSKR